MIAPSLHLAQGPAQAVTLTLAGEWRLNCDIPDMGPILDHDSFQPGFKLQLHHKDLRICQEMARQLGIELPLTDTTEKHYQTLMANGHGEEDISALYRLKRPSV